MDYEVVVARHISRDRTGSTRLQPRPSITARTCSSGGSIAMRKHVLGRHFGRSRNCKKFTCFDQIYLEPSNSMFLPLFSHVPMVVKHKGASRGPGQRRQSTGGRVARHGTPHSGTGQSGAPRFSPYVKKWVWASRYERDARSAIAYLICS